MQSDSLGSHLVEAEEWQSVSVNAGFLDEARKVVQMGKQIGVYFGPRESEIVSRLTELEI